MCLPASQTGSSSRPSVVSGPRVAQRSQREYKRRPASGSDGTEGEGRASPPASRG